MYSVEKAHQPVYSNTDNPQQNFMRAVYKNDLEKATLLLQNEKVDINKLNLGHKSALYLAIENENVHMVKMLVENGADINTLSYCNMYCSYETPVVTSTRLHNEELVRFFLQRHCEIECAVNNINKKESKNALHWSADYGDIEIAELLLKHGAHLDWKGPHMHTALHYAVISDQKPMVEWLLNRGAKISPNGDGRTILHIAAVWGNLHTIQLISDKLDINVKDNFGFTPFALACLRGHIKIVRHFYNQCKEKKRIDMVEGLLRSAEGGHVSIMAFLLENGAAVNGLNSSGETALSIACHGRHSQQEQLEAVKLLLEHGAYINVVDSRGYTPLSMALLREQNDIAALLIKHGALVDAVKPSYDSPMLIAFNTSNPLLVKYLIQAGCHFCREKWFTDVAVNEKISELDFHTPGPFRFRKDSQLQKETWEWIRGKMTHPRTLTQISRRTIRKHLITVGDGSSVLPKIKLLPLPPCMKNFLSLEDVLLE